MEINAMILLVSTHQDETVRAVYEALSVRQDQPKLLWLTDVELLSGIGWSHRQADGVTTTTLRLSNGRSVCSTEITAVFNRLSFLNPHYFATFNEVDRQYAASEMFALLLSWLASLRCPFINPVGARDLAGGSRSLLGWLQLAGQSGLPTRQAQFTTNARLVAQKSYAVYQPMIGAGIMQTSFFTPVASGLAGQNPALLLSTVTQETRRLLVIGDEVSGDLPEMFAGCLRLAQLSKTRLLECVFSHEDSLAPENWLLSAVNPLPSLAPSEAAAVAELLARRNR
jgi:hypothetical protein